MHRHNTSCFVHTFPIFRFVRWYACHACLCHPLDFYASLHACLHVHARVFLASVSSMLQHNEVMDIWSKQRKPMTWYKFSRLHLSLTDTTFCSFSCLFVFLLICLLSYFFACHAYHACLLYAFSYALCIFSFHCLFAGFLFLPLHVHTWSEDVWS